MLPVACTKATWVPSGALELPDVKPLPLLLTPAPPEKVQGVPTGSYWKLPVPMAGDSKPASRMLADSSVRPSSSSSIGRELNRHVLGTERGFDAGRTRVFLSRFCRESHRRSLAMV